MEAPPKPLFDPEKAKRGKAIAAVCALTILATTILQAVPNLHFGNEGFAGELVRIVLVLVCGVGAVQGFTLAVFLVSAYCSLAGTYLFIRSVYNVETVDSYMLTLGVLYFLSAIVLSLSPAVSENNKQRRFRDVQS